MSTQLVSAPTSGAPTATDSGASDSGALSFSAPLPLTTGEMLARVTHTEQSFESRRANRTAERARAQRHRSTFVAPRGQVVLAWVATVTLAVAGGSFAAALLVLN